MHNKIFLEEKKRRTTPTLETIFIYPVNNTAEAQTVCLHAADFFFLSYFNRGRRPLNLICQYGICIIEKCLNECAWMVDE